jgi:hypothetical protein
MCERSLKKYIDYFESGSTARIAIAQIACNWSSLFGKYYYKKKTHEYFIDYL